MAPFICMAVPAACFDVSVSSYAKPGIAPGMKYFILPGNKDITPSDFEFQEYAGELVRAMSSKGYVQVTNADDADEVIYLGYGISGPIDHLVTSFASVDSSSTSQTMVAGSVGMTPVTGTATTTTESNSYIPEVGTVTSYKRMMVLIAADAKTVRADPQRAKLWQEVVTSEGRSGDLRRLMPVMIYAASSYFGRNSYKMVATRISFLDKNVKALAAVPNQ